MRYEYVLRWDNGRTENFDNLSAALDRHTACPGTALYRLVPTVEVKVPVTTVRRQMVVADDKAGG